MRLEPLAPVPRERRRDAARRSGRVGRLTSNVSTRSTRNPRSILLQAMEADHQHARRPTAASARARVARRPGRCAAALCPRAPVAERDCCAERPARIDAGEPHRGHRRRSRQPRPVSPARRTPAPPDRTRPRRAAGSRRGRDAQHANATDAQREPEQPAGSRQEQALDQQLAGKPAPAGAERGADRRTRGTRPVARTRTRLATFTQATSSTSPTAISSTCSGPRDGATRSSLQRRARPACSRARPATASANARLRAPRSPRVPARDSRRSAAGRPRSRCSSASFVFPRQVVGQPRVHFARQSDLRSPAGAMPTTSYGSALKWTVAPMTDGSLPKRVRHSASLRTTRGAPALVGAARIPGPRSGPERSVRK